MTEYASRKAPTPLVELSLGIAWLLGSAAALLIIERLLRSATLAAAILGAVLVDAGASRAGVRWSEADEGARFDWQRALKRVAAGAGVALALGGIVLAVAVARGWLHGHEGPSLSSAVLFAMVRAAAVATRDELLFRGIPIVAAARAGVPAPIARAFAALAGGAAIALVPGVTPAAIAIAVASGWLTAALWQRERGAFMAVGARAGWLLLFGSLLHGGLFDVDWNVGSLAIGNTSWGAPAWLSAGVLAVGALVVSRIPRKGDGVSK